MKNLFLTMFVLIFGFIGCGKLANSEKSPDPNLAYVHVDSVFYPYIKRIKETLYRLEVSDLSIQKINFVNINFEVINDSATGICNIKTRTENGNKIITKNIQMDLLKWNFLNDEKKRNILAHELGHCAWDLEHLATENQIMSPVVANIDESAWIYFANQIKKSL